MIGRIIERMKKGGKEEGRERKKRKGGGWREGERMIDFLSAGSILPWMNSQDGQARVRSREFLSGLPCAENTSAIFCCFPGTLAASWIQSGIART